MTWASSSHTWLYCVALHARALDLIAVAQLNRAFRQHFTRGLAAHSLWHKAALRAGLTNSDHASARYRGLFLKHARRICADCGAYVSERYLVYKKLLEDVPLCGTCIRDEHGRLGGTVTKTQAQYELCAPFEVLQLLDYIALRCLVCDNPHGGGHPMRLFFTNDVRTACEHVFGGKDYRLWTNKERREALNAWKEQRDADDGALIDNWHLYVPATHYLLRDYQRRIRKRRRLDTLNASKRLKCTS